LQISWGGEKKKKKNKKGIELFKSDFNRSSKRRGKKKGEGKGTEDLIPRAHEILGYYRKGKRRDGTRRISPFFMYTTALFLKKRKKKEKKKSGGRLHKTVKFVGKYFTADGGKEKGSGGLVINLPVSFFTEKKKERGEEGGGEGGGTEDLKKFSNLPIRMRRTKREKKKRRGKKEYVGKWHEENAETVSLNEGERRKHKLGIKSGKRGKDFLFSQLGGGGGEKKRGRMAASDSLSPPN